MKAVDASQSNKSTVIEQFKNDEHLTMLLQKFTLAFEQEELCDVSFIAAADGTRVSAHRLVLTSACDYFGAMFTGTLKEARETEITLQDIPGDILKVIIQYCYTGAIEINSENVENILKHAAIYQIAAVVKACCDYMANQVHPSNSLGLALFAEQQSFTELADIAWNYTCNHFMRVNQNEEFMLLSEVHLARILSNNDLGVTCEEEAFTALEAWVNHNAAERNKYIASLLPHIRLPLLKQEFLTERVQPFCNRVPCQDALVQCQQLLIEAFKYQAAKPLTTPVPKVLPRRSNPSRLLVVGGTANNSFDIEIYEPLIDQWRVVDELPQKNRQLSCSGYAVLEDKLIIVGGRDGLTTSSAVECIDFNKMTCSLLPSMNVSRSNLSVAVVDNILYSIGGHDDRAYKKSVERYDPSTCTWNYVAAMNSARGGAGVAVIGIKIYIVGGCDKINNSHSSVECYDTMTNVWRNCRPMNKKRYGVGVGVFNGLIYAVGGRNLSKSDRILTVERYDPNLDKWEYVASLEEPCYNMGLAVLGNRLIIAGGSDLDNVKRSDVQQYNPEKDRWTTLSSLNVPRASIDIIPVSEKCINHY